MEKQHFKTVKETPRLLSERSSRRSEVMLIPTSVAPLPESSISLLAMSSPTFREIARYLQQHNGNRFVQRRIDTLGSTLRNNRTSPVHHENGRNSNLNAGSHIFMRTPHGGESKTIQLSPLSDELENVWLLEGREALFERLRSLEVCDRDVVAMLERNLPENDLLLARRMLDPDQRPNSHEAPAVNPEISNLPWARYVDNFQSVIYDLDYRNERGNLSRWLTTKYADGTTIDINIFTDFSGETMSGAATRNAMAQGRVGAGSRIFPNTLTPQTTPRLWAARQSALEVMDQYNVQFITGTLPAVAFIITMPLVAIGGGPPRAIRQPLMRRATSQLTERSGLLNELRRLGIRFSESNILFITRTPSGRIIWLESGNAQAGMQHIWLRHAREFATIGIRSESELQSTLLSLIRGQNPLRVAGGAHDYSIVLNSVQRSIRIVVGDNGFIVTAHPI